MVNDKIMMTMRVNSNDNTYAMSYGGAIGNKDITIPEHKLITAIHERGGLIDSVDTETIGGANVAFTTSHTAADIGTTLADVFDLAALTGAASVSAGIDAAASIGGEAKILATTANSALANKVDKVTGKGLSTNDFSTDYKSKLDSMQNPVSAISKNSSTNTVSVTYDAGAGTSDTVAFYTTSAVDSAIANTPLVVNYRITESGITCSASFEELWGAISSDRGAICTFVNETIDENDHRSGFSYVTYTLDEYGVIEWSSYGFVPVSHGSLGNVLMVTLFSIHHYEHDSYTEEELIFTSESSHYVPILSEQ